MKYQSRGHTPPRNSGRLDLVRRMSSNYEQQAQAQASNALGAAAFEIMLYKIKTHGAKCTCCHDMKADVLTDDGHMSQTAMNEIINQTLAATAVDTTNTRRRAVVVSAAPYNPLKLSSGSANFDALTINSDGALIEDANNDNIDDLDQPDPEDLFALEQFDLANPGFDYVSAVTSNCAVCSRTGFVGGFNLVNGDRRVYDCQRMSDLSLCSVDFTRAPHRIVSLHDGFASVTFTDTLPKSIWRVITFRPMREWAPVAEWELYALESPTVRVPIRTNRDLQAFCTGTPVQFELRFKGELTHVEFLLQATSKPLFADITPLNRSSSNKRLNDLDAITFNLPATVGTVRRGDVFFEKSSRVLWVVTQVEVQRSARNPHGYTGSAERVKSRYEPYALFNPFQMSAGETV